MGEDRKNRGGGAAQWIAVLLLLAILLTLVVSALSVVPRLTAAAESVQAVCDRLDTSLEGVDLGTMLTDINQLVADSQSGVELAAEKINAVDVEGLNQAIADLTSIVSPLSALFGH